MASVKLQVALGGRVARVSLSRPETKNAFDRAMLREIGDLVRGVADSEKIRIVLLDGAGDTFCSGADLAAAVKSDSVSRYLGTLSKEFNSVLNYLTTVPSIVVTFTTGKTTAGGVALALAGDIRWAVPGASFRCHAARTGLSVDGGLSWRLPRLVGLSAAQRMIFEDREVGAEEAKSIGLIHDVVDPKTMGQAMGAIIENTKTMPRGVFARNRQLLLGNAAKAFPDALAEEASVLKTSAGTKDGDEGIRAAVEGRTPGYAT